MENTQEQVVSPTAPPAQSIRFNWNYIFFVGILLISVIVFLMLPKAYWMSWRRFVSTSVLGSDYIDQKSQSIGEIFVIPRLRVNKPGFVVLMFAPGNSNLGSTALVSQKGTVWDVPLEVNRELVYQMKPEATESPTDLYLGLYYDDGDGEFSFEYDQIAKNPFGDPILEKVRLHTEAY
jgi:hypothetical protein